MGINRINAKAGSRMGIIKTIKTKYGSIIVYGEMPERTNWYAFDDWDNL